ncbi:MAG: hypothetical protein ACLQBA_10235 [Candidatus Binataceae bacterium]
MFVERRLNQSDNRVELWQCEWEKAQGAGARKVYLKKLGEEQPLIPEAAKPIAETPAICWSYGRTLGNIAVFSPSLLGRFAGLAGNDAQLPCDFVHAGKFRHGSERWWCRTHQTHWGTKADQESFEQFGEMRCANHTQPMNYVLSPLTINLTDHAEVGIWCSMPAALSTEKIVPRPPKIHVHVRPDTGGKKTIDRDFDAISLLYSDSLGLFGNSDITRVNVTPPAAFEFVCGLEANREMTCINCSSCGYPHLDLGDFARTAHRKHFCGNCGRDSTWSKDPIVSTPLKLLHDEYATTLKYETPDRSLDLDDYQGCSFTVWASTPAIVWTAARPQEFGIHVHVHDGQTRVVDETYGKLTLQGKQLERSSLIDAMMQRSII